MKPSIAKLHVLGVYYSYVQNLKKLVACSRKGYFIGYDKESPMYLAYYPESDSVTKHRVVQVTDKFEMSRAPVDKRDLFTD